MQHIKNRYHPKIRQREREVLRDLLAAYRDLVMREVDELADLELPA